MVKLSFERTARRNARSQTGKWSRGAEPLGLGDTEAKEGALRVVIGFPGWSEPGEPGLRGPYRVVKCSYGPKGERVPRQSF